MTAPSSALLHQLKRPRTILRNAFPAINQHISQVCTRRQVPKSDGLLQTLCCNNALPLCAQCQSLSLKSRDGRSNTAGSNTAHNEVAHDVDITD
jgi:hypothetical protein